MHKVTLTPIQLAYGRIESVRPGPSFGRIHVAGKRTKHAKTIQLPLVTPCHSKKDLHDLSQECQLL